ncbi:heat shock protein 9/12-domain-containing protein [Desarmillaria tabescens]|uniref:Heat shock protein 9/12-domain-containing protein n=1 Tax=Armillaria tabescens TaxID=1929756 RepID=A0AA39N6M4_ARMTA|nr:heat shock protein 9/12-domain-containing protein [Desarmillaria tabescens]KAK0459827.1 heat shock protein 9/12-domain-containing protein [Desarmillaria tabescens]
MSDTGRQWFTDKAGSAMKPDSQKSATERMGDNLKGYADSAASTLQPQGEKTSTQKMGDTVSGNSNDNDQSMLGKAKGAMGLSGTSERSR